MPEKSLPIRLRSWYIRLTNWEYWPFNVVYAPILPYWLLLVIRSRSFFFFNTSNPRIKNGGFLLESKKDIYELLPAGTYPTTIFFRGNSPWQNIKAAVGDFGLSYPMIAKPDIGMRGMRVQRVDNEDELRAYAAAVEVDFLVQALVEYPLEAGIFYCRIPGEQKGRISGIVSKEFLKVIGDGESTIGQLLSNNSRGILQISTLQSTQPELMKVVLPKGVEKIVVPYGNHARGACFLDNSREADDALHNMIDGLCSQIPDFYFGRLDIRFTSWDELRLGRQFSIIEVNGAGSEPTHIYDPQHTLFFAWKEIIRHWNILFRISRDNHRVRHLPYMSFSEGIRMIRENSAYVKKIAKPLRVESGNGNRESGIVNGECSMVNGEW